MSAPLARSGSAAAPAGSEGAVEAEQLRLLMQNPADVPVNLINAGLVALVVWRLYPATLVALWLGLFTVTSLSRALLRRRYAIASSVVKASPNWARVFTLHALAAGGLWGLSASVILMTPDPVYYDFIVFVLGGTMAGGVVCLAVNRRAMLAFILPTILPAIVLLVIHGGLIEIEMAAMLALFALVLASTGASINRSIAQNVRLRVGQESLVAHLRASEATSASLAAIVDASDDAIISETVAGRILTWNRGAERLFGYRADEAIGQNVRVIVPGDRGKEIDSNLAALAQGQRIAPFDTERLRKDGTRVPVSVAVSLTYDSARSVVGASFIARDISERQIAARALVYGDELLHAVTIGTGMLLKGQSLDLAMPQALRVVGEAMRVDRVLVVQDLAGNVAPMALHLGWEAPGIQMSVTSAPSWIDTMGRATAPAWVEMLSDGKPVIAQLATSDGSVRALLAGLGNKSTLIVPIFVGEVLWGGLIADTCKMARDWTESEINTLKTFGDIAGLLIRRSETLRSLETSEARFRAVTETAQDAIITVDGAARIGLWNHAAERILGYTVEEAVGKHVHQFLVPSRFRSKADAGMDAFLSTGKGNAIGRTTQLTALRKDGTEIAVELSLAATRLDVGHGAIGVLRDVTDRKNAEEKLQFANLLLRTQMEASRDGILIVDESNAIVAFNQLFATIWKIPDADLKVGANAELLAKAASLVKDSEKFVARVRYLHDHPDEDSQDEFETTDGRSIDRYTVTLYSPSHVYLGRAWFFRDITERKNAEDKLQFANLLLRTQLEASRDGIVVVDESNTIIAFNQLFATIWKIPDADLKAGADAAVLAKVASSVADSAKFVARVRYLYDHPGEDSQDEFETTDGRSIDRYTVTLYSPSYAYLGRAWFFRDITERKHTEALALRMARFDVLTGLANRADFVEALNHAIAAAKIGEKSFAVIYLDLDHFKDVNDTLGRPIGDELLKTVADRLRANTRETDTLARFGGDEFAILVAYIRDPADAAILADKLLAALAVPYSILGRDIHSGASMGIAAYGPESAQAETLLSNAEVALYRAKGEGRGGYRLFTDLMDTEVKSRVTLGAELRTALDQGEFFLMYQPQVEIDTGRITGVEALVRWRHPQRGVIGPDLFIPLAEQIGVISKLGHWVLWEACRQAKAWLDDGVPPVRMAVNLSALQFRNVGALDDDINSALAQTGLPPRLLELELTESVLMAAMREQSDMLQRFRETGVTIAIDDFGTGFSSLSYLRRFQSDRIKIAQVFVTNMESTPGDAAIIRATIGLARELKIAIIAEGVENRVQYDLLKAWGCGEIQGFLFARPLSAQDAADVLRKGKILPPIREAGEGRPDANGR